MSKKFPWLKIKAGFCKSKEIQLLKKQKNGFDLCWLWLELLCLAIDDVDDEKIGVLRFNEKIPYSSGILADLFGMDKGLVADGIKSFEAMGMVEIKEDGEIWIEEANMLIGRETDAAERMRQFRERNKINKLGKKNVTLLQDVTDELRGVTNSYTEKRREEKRREEENIQKKNFSDDFDYSGFSSDEVVAIKKWFEYKAARKQRYKTFIGIKTLCTVLKKLSKRGVLIESVEWSISREWAGIYEQKNEDQHAKQLQVQQRSHFQSHLLGLAEGARAIQEREEREQQRDIDRGVCDFSENEAGLEQF